MKFLFIILLPTLFDLIRANDDSLELVHVFFRHGSRTPELKDVYPTDPYNAETFWPMGYGALTNKGKQNAFKLGKLLREKYQTFLGNLYIPESIQATSTDYDRTKMTLLLVLAGLFPPSPIQKWDDDMPWLPVPIQYDKDKDDYTLRRPIHYCPTYVKELEDVLLSDEIFREIKNHKSLLKYIEEYTGKPMKTLSDVFSIYQTLCAENSMNLTLPEWTESVYPSQIYEIASKQCYYENGNSILKRLNGGRMLGKIITHMVDKSNNNLSPPGRKIFLYSGHENNVINILAALNLFKPHVPKYTAAVIVELHHSKDIGFAVKVVYLRDVNSEFEEQKLEGCDSLCPLNSFIRITEPHVPVNYTAECHSHVNLD